MAGDVEVGCKKVGEFEKGEIAEAVSHQACREPSMRRT